MSPMPPLRPLALLPLLVALGCGGGTAPHDGGSTPHGHAGTALESIEPFAGKLPIEIVCTTGMVADIVRNVGGDHVQSYVVGDETFEGQGDRLIVRQLFGANVDPHTHRPTGSDTRLLADADLIVYSGLHLEGKLTEILERMADRKPTYAVTSDLPADRLLVDRTQSDPHVWMDASLWSEAAEHVGTLLAKIDPDHAADYAANTKTYRAELAKLHDEAKQKIATLPESQRVLVTAHDAFTYFSKAYGIEVRSIQGISTESEASVQDVNELVDFIVERRIKAVFVETSVNDRNVKSLIEGCQSRGHAVRIGGELYSDAMGEPGTPEGTYVGMIRHNVDTIVGALQ
jgi:manganese/zinc/iron transport system substrate-binding protein